MKFGELTLDHARELDKKDELSAFRDKFVVADHNMVYLDGNSLGRLPRDTAVRIRQVVEKEWGEKLIRGWNEGWIDASVRIREKLSRIIGATPDEVIITDATSVNLFKLAFAALKYKASKKNIVSDELNFPSDLYILQGVIDALGNNHKLMLAQSEDGIGMRTDRITELIDDDTALVALTHTCFKSSFVYDMTNITRATHDHNALVLWDLSHSVGAIPVHLHECGADLAVGCTYKYLNGGPGSPAFIFVRKDLQQKLMQPIWGWLGSDDPFSFKLDYEPARNITRYQVGTPPVISMLSIEPGLDLHLEAGIDRLRKKSIMQTEYLIWLFDQWLAPLGFELGSPREAENRGSHISIQHPEAFRICRALIEAEPPDLQVIPDFRTPDNMRLGVAPIYTSYKDLFMAMGRIREVVEKRIYKKYSKERSSVT